MRIASTFEVWGLLFVGSYNYPNTYIWNTSVGEFVNWLDTIRFNTQTGLPQILVQHAVPFQDYQASVEVTFYTSIYGVSGALRAMLTNPQDRMFMFFRNPGGVLIGASNGKFFSHSDIDYSENNPISNPPPVSEFRTYTALNSTDATIYSAAVQLIQQYQRWDWIPVINVVSTYNGAEYWVTTSPLSSAVCVLPCF